MSDCDNRECVDNKEGICTHNKCQKDCKTCKDTGQTEEYDHHLQHMVAVACDCEEE